MELVLGLPVRAVDFQAYAVDMGSCARYNDDING